MKLKKLGILVAVAAVLAVMTGSMASAATYSGEFVTTLATDNSVALRYSSWGNLPGSGSLSWYNGFHNRLPREVSVTVTQSTSPANGLQFTQSIGGMNLAVDPNDLGVIDQPVTCSVSVSGSHTIYSTHVYRDRGTNYTSSADSLMTYY
jgi:hypothetical protein